MSGNQASELSFSSPFWGPVTATLDWCEANYQHFHYVAETTNTFSNLFTIALALYGAYQTRIHLLPSRYFIGYTGFALVGLGSLIFHATLLFEAQLADELPMVYVASYCCGILLDTQPGFSFSNSRTLPLAVLYVLFNVLFTWSYCISRNPIYHQVVFATLMLSTAVRTVHLLRKPELRARLPEQMRTVVGRTFTAGASIFAFGFFVWNLDNVFCGTVTGWKKNIGWPGAFLLEGHSWWHVFTAIGTYLMLVGNTYFTLCIKDDYRKYGLGWLLGLPYITRLTPVKSKAKTS